MRSSALMMLIPGLLVASMAMAQTAPAQRGPRGAGAERGFQQLNLSADQQSQVKQLMQYQRTQMQALRGNSSLTPEQRKDQVRQLRESNHQKMMALLSPEQQAQFKQLRQQRRGRVAAFQSGRRFQGMQALNLTEQQKDQMKPVFESSRQQMRALRQDTSLTPDQRREKIKQIRENQRAQLNTILTPEQQQQLQQMHQHRRRGPQNATPPQGL
jgi:Spy/CpxP family protein refolding chaperone